MEAPPIVPAGRDEALPLSFAQQRLWFFDQLQPNSATYNMPFPMRLTGQLDLEALRRTLREIVRRHEALRTTFVSVDGEPVQVINPAWQVELPVVDLSELSEDRREAETNRLAAEEARRPFDLKQNPPLRAGLIKISEDDHVVLLTLHHISSDAWSMGVMVREIVALYGAFHEGRPSPLPELPVQYADYALWQRRWLQGEVLDAQMSYWREQLAGAPVVLELPTDRPRPSMQTHRGAQLPLMLPEKLSESVKALGRREGVTLFMTLLAAWQTLLARYSGQEDVVVGTPIANRNRAEVEPLIGFFVNTLALRARVTPGMSFRELLAQVRETCLGAYAHQDLPFEKLVEELRPERSLSHTPLFQVMFALQNAGTGSGRSPELPGLKAKSLKSGGNNVVFDLTLNLSEMKGKIVGSIHYNVSLFDEGTIRRMADHFERLLEMAAANPDAELRALPMLTDAERRVLLDEWSTAEAEYPSGVCVHQLFERQVERAPEATAAVFGEEEVSYRELNERANQVAH
ncbi:MAG TPA: condensation domain-containing protein, partial [Pyrinomonadaceae bacterium]|nr:condensation domain-containing protein [Pyrinomonadaceae bacterium]